MSINPLSDIVLDVARAAEPSRLADAQSRLTGSNAGFSLPADATTDARRSQPARPVQVNWSSPGRAAVPLTDADNPKAAALRGLEQAFLTQLIELTLPRAGGSAFGGGPAGPMWRGMLAEQTAQAMVKGGGTGIAKQLAGHVAAGFSEPSAKTV